MTHERSGDGEPRLLGVLLAPLRAPQRVAGDIETIAGAVLSLQRDARERLASVDQRAGALVSAVGALGTAVGALRAPLERVDRKVTQLTKLEQAITVRMDSIHDDLNARMLAVEQEVHGMRAPIEKMCRDVSSAVELLPNPADGPLTRLKDSLTSS